ncbi:hypothetical protein [Mobilicoccus pelagius]|uniref:Methyl-accepting chemotaxis protein n=1 Tax=Mobilicoccus pelagius NBRC 104925 TaxID=1089455 RepID=H5UUP1_9MICO|nr:hypothetical protein [Mobilicoccus pelagius]GAB49449.1 hypothetical protein MOPEL_130_00560 [Mobilicoccus pelagius NBRC 104925]
MNKSYENATAQSEAAAELGASAEKRLPDASQRLHDGQRLAKWLSNVAALVFAPLVVARGVGGLTQKRSKATEDLGRRVEAVQVDTEAAVAAISEIASFIAQINDFQATIASAVEEQTATTNEMGRNVSDAAEGTSAISAQISGAPAAVAETTTAAANTSEAAQELSRQTNELTTPVGRFRYRCPASRAHGARRPHVGRRAPSRHPSRTLIPRSRRDGPPGRRAPRCRGWGTTSSRRPVARA